MSKIYIKFKNHPQLKLNIKDTKITNQWVKLLQYNINSSLPVYRDRIKYNVEYMFELAHRARVAFNWDWEVPTYDLAHTTILHKDLERLLGETGFKDVPEEYDHLLMEMHYCLHIVQNPNKIGTRFGAFQVEWFNDIGFDLDNEFVFGTQKEFGDVELLNPFVGHGPVQIFQENDYTDIPQTCKFHNFVKAGLVISTFDSTVDRTEILNYFKKHAPDFVRQHGEHTIQHYTGFPTVGRVDNLEDFRQLLNCPEIIELESMDFDD